MEKLATTKFISLILSEDKTSSNIDYLNSFYEFKSQIFDIINSDPDLLSRIRIYTEIKSLLSIGKEDKKKQGSS